MAWPKRKNEGDERRGKGLEAEGKEAMCGNTLPPPSPPPSPLSPLSSFTPSFSSSSFSSSPSFSFSSSCSSSSSSSFFGLVYCQEAFDGRQAGAEWPRAHCQRAVAVTHSERKQRRFCEDSRHLWGGQRTQSGSRKAAAGRRGSLASSKHLP